MEWSIRKAKLVARSVLLGLLGMGVWASAQVPAWQAPVQKARVELRELVKEEITEEMIAKRMGFPWPLAEASISPAALAKTVQDEVAARLKTAEAGPQDQDLQAIADAAFPVWKVGDEVSFRDKRGRRITGRIRSIYPGSVQIGMSMISLGDMDAETRAHFDEKAAEDFRNRAMTAERSKFERGRSKLEAELKAEIEERLHAAHGYLLIEGNYVSPADVRQRVAYARLRQIEWEAQRREADFMAKKGFVRWDRDWIPVEARDALLAQAAERREVEKNALAGFVALKAEIKDRDISGDMANLVLISVDLVSGEKASGSGFVLRNGFRKCVVTNQHVLVGAKAFTMQTAAGTVLRPKSIALGKSQDIAEVTFVCAEGVTEPAGFELALNEPSLGSAVLVLGNSQGAGVVTGEAGGVLGVGPDLIEVSAEFVAGNSGSPILNPAGNVLGIATFASRDGEDWVAQNSRYTKVRRFGVRLRWNAYPEFTSTTWQEFTADGCLLKDLDHYGYDLYLMVSAEVTTTREYKKGGYADGYCDSLWGGRAMTTMREFERLWDAAKRPRAGEILKVVEETDTNFQKEIDRIRNTISSHQWQTGFLKTEADDLGRLCGILQDLHQKATQDLLRKYR